MIQVYISNVVVLSAESFILSLPTITDCLINIMSLLIVNEMDNFVGKYFALHLKSHYQPIVARDDFLKFKVNEN